MRKVEVTARQRQVYEMRNATDPPPSWSSISKALYGTDKKTTNVKKFYAAAVENLENEGRVVKREAQNSLEKTRPEAAAMLVDRVTNPDPHPMESLAKAARDAGVPENTAQRFIERMRTNYFPSMVEVQNVKVERLRDLWSQRTEQALAAMTPEKFEKAGVRELAIMAGIGTEKKLLLEGRPTEIVRTEGERKDLLSLVGSFLVEAKRRGIDVSVDPGNQTVNLESKPRG